MVSKVDTREPHYRHIPLVRAGWELATLLEQIFGGPISV